MGRIKAAGLIGVAMLGACAHVPLAPVDLPARAAARIAAQIDLPRIRATAEAIAPTVSPPAEGLDRLALFAAILVHDPRVAEARAALDTARRDARAARKVGSPTFTLTSEYANDPSTSSPWLLGASVDLPLDLAGRRNARLAGADLAVVSARLDLAETVWAERVAMQRALVDAMAGAEQARLGDAIVALRDRQLGVLEDRARRGEIPGLDLYPYRAQRAAAARALADAHARAASGRGAVAGVLGLSVSALGDLALRWPDFADALQPAAPLSAEDRARAIAARSDVLRALAAYDRSEADLRGEVARQYPAISVGPGYTWERGLVKLPFALNLSLPGWDLNHSAIAAAEARRSQAGAALESALAGAQAALEAARTERIAALAAARRIREQELPQAVATAHRADVQLQMGAIGRSEWAAAQIAAREAELAAVDSLVRLRLTVIAEEDAARKPLDGPETRIEPALLQRVMLEKSS
ncbi:MAG: hypothetical protein RIS94_2052 [Pseudomonadota bacterium]